MTSGPKRRGCDVCRKRHVKCDRQLPSCCQCIKAGWDCPGYASDFSFVNYSPNHPTGRVKGDEATFSSSYSKSPALSRDDLSSSRGSLSRLEPKPSPEGSLSPTSPVQSLRDEFVDALDKGTLAAGMETLMPRVYLRYFPPMIDTCYALDSAVRLVLIASKLPKHDRDATTSSAGELLTAYQTAIAALRDAIADEDKVRYKGTLMAAVLLRMYEQHSAPAGVNRSFHARGVSRLTQVRDPNSYQTESDYAMLEIASVSALYVATKDGQECFLHEKAWSAVFSRMTRQPQTPGRMTPHQVKLVQLWSYMPGFQAAFHNHVDRVAATTALQGSTSGVTLHEARMQIFDEDRESHKMFSARLVAQRSRQRTWWSEVHPLDPNDSPGAWPTHLELAMHVFMATQLCFSAYYMATICPEASVSMPELICSESPFRVTEVDLGPRPYDLSNDLLLEVRQLTHIIHKYVEAYPGHIFFAESQDGCHISMKWYWERARDHPPGLVSPLSEDIAALVDWAMSRASVGHPSFTG